MKIRNEQFSASEAPAGLPEDTLLFDIETTGLSHRTSHLYLIGAAHRSGERWTLCQWLLQSPTEEPALLEAFSAYAKDFPRVMHYNGQTFDLPYLRHKYQAAGLPFPLEQQESTDLYRVVQKFRGLFGFSSMKQRDIEPVLGISRTDQMDGGALISVYRNYLQTASEELEALLFLHNHDDVLGMIGLSRLQACAELFEGSFTLSNAVCTGDVLHLTLALFHPLPLPISVRLPEAELTAEGCTARMSVPARRGTFRHYFDNYRDYYYLPLEDTAVHKSVGVYVDPACRVKATKETCYQTCSGLFCFQPVERLHPVFYPESRKTSRPCFQISDGRLPSAEDLKGYAEDLLSWFLAEQSAREKAAQKERL